MQTDLFALHRDDRYKYIYRYAFGDRTLAHLMLTVWQAYQNNLGTALKFGTGSNDDPHITLADETETVHVWFMRRYYVDELDENRWAMEISQEMHDLLVNFPEELQPSISDHTAIQFEPEKIPGLGLVGGYWN